MWGIVVVLSEKGWRNNGSVIKFFIVVSGFRASGKRSGFFCGWKFERS